MLTKGVSMNSFKIACTTALAMIALPAGATTIGPDSFGYTATDQVNYTFRDITSTGTVILQNVDDASVLVDLGMSFNFYGVTYTSAYLSSNGIITFGGSNSSFTNRDLTSTQIGNGPGIFSFWDDLITPTDTDARRGVYYQTIGSTPGSRQFVVQEIANSFAIGGSSINFQTVLDEATGDILVRYTDVAFGDDRFDYGASATVGIQNVLSAGQVVQWSFNQPTLQANQSLCFTVSPNAACQSIAPTGAVPEPATWAMMIGGFGIVGGALRRRATAARVSFA